MREYGWRTDLKIVNVGRSTTTACSRRSWRSASSGRRDQAERRPALQDQDAAKEENSHVHGLRDVEALSPSGRDKLPGLLLENYESLKCSWHAHDQSAHAATESVTLMTMLKRARLQDSEQHRGPCGRDPRARQGEGRTRVQKVHPRSEGEEQAAMVGIIPWSSTRRDQTG